MYSVEFAPYLAPLTHSPSTYYFHTGNRYHLCFLCIPPEFFILVKEIIFFVSPTHTLFVMKRYAVILLCILLWETFHCEFLENILTCFQSRIIICCMNIPYLLNLSPLMDMRIVSSLLLF